MKASKLVASLLVALSLPATAIAQTFVGSDIGTGAGGSRVNSDAARALWLGSAGSLYGTIDFESAPGGAFGAMGIGYGVTATQTGTSGGISSAFTDQLGYNTTAGGRQFLQHIPSGFGGASSLVLSFTNPTYGFGAYFTGVEHEFGTVTILWTDGGALSLVLPNTGSGGIAGVSFVGIVSAHALASITFSQVDEADRRDFWGIDDIELAGTEVVPEPASVVLMATGLAGLGFAARRRSRK